ncbi:Lipopolysaccharide export system permease protein LptF [Marinomonas spartinae]|uniref:Lipopolysaccharide export system permease protein LptF n=1 Tax=Marinomonas spartinae TaxID=1792290 RepID=A0A1A8TVJ1_9GAMM|nr:Lipopolysaccharide export system permease protein LptF [Marinomonas spartinae]SBS38645.1 Lipopolysaccharide export system permease protein LptF [Marinomonas spartinae]
MRLFRYLAKEVLMSTAGVTFILLIVILSGQFVNYLSRTTDGKMTFKFLFIILGYHTPSFIQMILPLAFFLSLLLAFGRLYIENEMSVLFSCGISKLKLASYTLGIALIVGLMSAALNFWIAPTSEYNSEKASQEQDQLSAFDFLQPGRFQGSGQRTTYIDSITKKEGWMNQIFLSSLTRKNNLNIPTVLMADYAEEIKMKSNKGLDYLVFKNGTRYEGIPGTANYRVTKFDTYAMRLKQNAPRPITDPETRSTLYLLKSSIPTDVAELQWRISLVIMIPILAIIGLSLSQVNPRQGRFFKMMPAILLMIFYIALLIWGRTALKKGSIPIEYGLWWIHGIFILIAAGLFLQYNQVFFRRKARLPKSNQSNSGTNEPTS